MLAMLQTCLTLFPQGRYHSRTGRILGIKKATVPLLLNTPSPFFSTIRKAVDHTYSSASLDVGIMMEGMAPNVLSA